MQGSPKRPKSQDERALNDSRDTRNSTIVSKDVTDEHQQKRVNLVETNPDICCISDITLPSLNVVPNICNSIVVYFNYNNLETVLNHILL